MRTQGTVGAPWEKWGLGAVGALGTVGVVTLVLALQGPLQASGLAQSPPAWTRHGGPWGSRREGLGVPSEDWGQVPVHFPGWGSLSVLCSWPWGDPNLRLKAGPGQAYCA